MATNESANHTIPAANKNPKQNAYGTVPAFDAAGPPCPEASAWFLSRLTFHWMTILIWKGYRYPLQLSDLFELDKWNSADHLASEFQTLWDQESRRLEPGQSVTVEAVLWRQFGTLYTVIGVFHLIQAACNIASPVIISNLTNFAEMSQDPSNPPPPVWFGLVFAFVFLALQLLATFSLNWYFYFSTMTGMRMRSCLTTVCYRKSMRLSSLARQQFTGGRILNMISSDLSRLEMFIMQGHYLWSGPVQVFSILALLIYFIRVSALAGFGLLIIAIPIQAVIFTRLGALRRTVAGISDVRIRTTQEYLQGMKIIKLFAWEDSFLNRLLKLRTEELRQIRYVNTWTAVLMGIATSIPILASVISFIVFALTNNALNPAIIFAALSLFNLMRFPLIILPNTVRSYVETRVGFRRMTSFLNAEELEKTIEQKSKSEYDIEINHASFKWETLSPDQVGDAIDKKSGKSLPAGGKASSGTVEALSNSKDKMDDVIHLKDINLKIKRGQLVAVAGPVGSGKSSLLSAILNEMKKLEGEVFVNGTIGYSLQQPWIQNGTLRSNITFGNDIDLERYQEAVEVTALAKDLEWLPGGSDALLGEKGVQISGGQKARVSLARIVYCRPDVVLLDDPLSAVDVHVGKHIFDYCIKKSLKDKTVVLVTHHLSYLHEVDHVVYMKEGRILEQGTYEEVMAIDGECARVVKSFAGEENKKEIEGAALKVDEKKGEKGGVAKGAMDEERVVGGVSFSVYVNYISAAGGPLMVLMGVILTVLTQGARVGNDLWLVAWSSDYFPQLATAGYAGIYFSWGMSQGITVAILGTMMAFSFALASRRFHQSALEGVFWAPMAFFDRTPLGRMINRFSRDTDTMDATLPMSLQMFLSIFAGLIATLALMCFSTPILMAPLAPLLVIYYFMQALYLRTSREVKRIEAISRSPMYAHITETMTGLSTIRAYRRQHDFINLCEKFVDTNIRAVYVQYMTQRWLGLRLEIIGAFICYFTALFAVTNATTISAALIGISLSYSLQVTGSLNFAIRQAVEVEVNANSIERLNHYAKNLLHEKERIVPDNRPPKDWPSQGAIKVEGLEIKYALDGPAVLKKISFETAQWEKIGVVGRTGAGKSTVTLALFRLLEPASGSIHIDGVDITKIGLHDLRSKLAIIPQDPVLFSGTIRSNLDPFNHAEDHVIWEVLESVNMKESVGKLADKLDSKVEPNGENFSTGQRQLLCLARAMLRKPKVLIMDEATANVDMESDQLIQMSLRRDFKKSTIITIAHRLNTVVDYDRILVLKQGEIVEFDSPKALLVRDSYFARMVDDTGASNAAVLRRLAAEKEEGKDVLEKLLSVEAIVTDNHDNQGASSAGSA